MTKHHNRCCQYQHLSHIVVISRTRAHTSSLLLIHFHHFLHFVIVVTRTYVVFAHPSSTFQGRAAVGHAKSSVVGLGLVIMMVVISENDD